MAARESTSPWVWALLFSILLAFAAFILYLDKKVVSSGNTTQTTRQSADSETKPTIDFYSVLPQREVEIPVSAEEQQAIENPSINKERANRFILQVGSFQSQAEADSQKAQLAFLGLQAKIEAAEVNKDTWYRVQLGPFAANSKFSQAKNLLIENNYKYIQRTLPE